MFAAEEEEPGEAEKSLTFSWELLGHEPRELQIRLTFDNPTALSTTSYGYDQMILQMPNPSMFKSAATGEPMGPDALEDTEEGGAPRVIMAVPTQIVED